MSFINLFQIHDRSSKNNCRNEKIHQTSFFVQNSHFSSDSSFHPILNSLKFIRFCSFSNTIYISVCISSMALLYFASLKKGWGCWKPWFDQFLWFLLFGIGVFTFYRQRQSQNFTSFYNTWSRKRNDRHLIHF